MTEDMDLAAYLRRIGYHATPHADFTTLAALATAHANAIAFENIDPFCGHPVQLDLGAIQAKLVGAGRGGYCFEHNHLFAVALRALGFRVEGLIARVLWGQPEDAITAETHMLLRVAAGGDAWLADVGFGSMTLLGALRLEPGVTQSTALEAFRLVRDGGEWRMQADIRGTWRTLYRFAPEPHPEVDYVVANHYVSTWPGSKFVQHLIAARVAGDRRLTLRDRVFSVRRPGMEPERHVLRDGAEVCAVLGDAFRIRVPDAAALARRIDALPAE